MISLKNFRESNFKNRNSDFHFASNSARKENLFPPLDSLHKPQNSPRKTFIVKCKSAIRVPRLIIVAVGESGNIYEESRCKKESKEKIFHYDE